MNRNDGAVGDARKRMTPDESTDSVRVAAVLATVMTEADCASPEYPFSDLSRARAILASDWLADVVAQAKAEALREAARDLPGFDDIRTHGDAANWLRRRANRIKSEATS